ncbi:ABC transporter permease [Dysgonomonas sp. 520]|uniref:ABC transporter permease n=1 Tax=Dysgonomonas sp. 520 TaxID=2302931 RepID=UPI0013D32753|nr:ABC transporter permease [Dysgonomonas sp. 520]
MNVSLYIAKRYLFSKKSHNAINVISMISVCGIAIATMAMVCTLSVFNGFTEIVTKTFSSFDPQLQIVPAKGKAFDPGDSLIQKATALPEIDIVSEAIEENALLRFEGRQLPVVVKGVSGQFEHLASIDSLILEGEFKLKEGDVYYGVIGAGLAMNLRVRANLVSNLEIYAPKRNVKVNLSNPATAFTTEYASIGGIFALNQQKYDEQLLLISIEQARTLFRYDREVTSLDIKLKNGISVDAVQKQMEEILGDNYLVKNRFQQQEDSYRMVSIEKWVTFFILAFILVIAVFNIIGSLSMLIIDKKEDIRILQNMGANNNLIVKIFMFEGWMISISGAIVGLILGLILCLLQQYFGLLKLGETPGAFIIDAYPVQVQILDIIAVFATVCSIGVVAILYPVNSLRKRLIRSDFN